MNRRAETFWFIVALGSVFSLGVGFGWLAKSVEVADALCR